MPGHHSIMFFYQSDDDQATIEYKGVMMRITNHRHSFGWRVLMSKWWEIVIDGSLEIDIKTTGRLKLFIVLRLNFFYNERNEDNEQMK